MGGETNVVSVLTPFNEGTDMLYCPQRGDHYSPFVVKTTHVVKSGTTPDRV